MVAVPVQGQKTDVSAQTGRSKLDRLQTLCLPPSQLAPLMITRLMFWFQESHEKRKSSGRRRGTVLFFPEMLTNPLGGSGWSCSLTGGVRWWCQITEFRTGRAAGKQENRKYFKRSELAKKEEEAYYERCGYKIQPKEEDQKPLTSSNPVLELELAEEKLPMTLSRQEVIRRLRERGEPIRLFGETDYDAFQRLRKIEILTPEVNKGLRNDLKAALDKIDQQYLNELVGGQEPGEEDTQNDLKVHEENTTIEELEALGESLGKGDDHKDMDIITKFLKFLLGVWAKELNAREDYVKRSVQGKLNSATQKQTESYLRPLFRKLRKRNLPADIKESITDIIKFMLQREYVKANDAYLQMAIGNAPWPIGVTMVGIHARTGREKIFSKHVAHVLNDETQRKYIQGLKRLMTICQKHFPTDPSKCVEYNAL
ncbi:PREDICTED: pre-mRNA-splicing factor 18 isoform X2 [Hipposideros armiger]|uniref:Pre-mRNA-splicing factor 18 n=1 Tax=Hipposideros armiger TaxID=186990 RepID=A0A8B7T4D1_HIPAR|nr:PREDICTED: pre-mRNA-splicing factor 18 isoform X2 [Hipposideros armiger]